MCEECYVNESRITPLLNPIECLEHHTQYICGICGRCICIEHDPKRGLQRWYFPFKSLEIAKLYLRTAIDAHHASPMMETISKLREKYNLHMSVERFVPGGDMPESDKSFIKDK